MMLIGTIKVQNLVAILLIPLITYLKMQRRVLVGLQAVVVEIQNHNMVGEGRALRTMHKIVKSGQ